MADKIKLLIVTQHLEGGGAEKILWRIILNLHSELDITLVTLYNKGRYLDEILSLPGIKHTCIHAEKGNTLAFSLRLRRVIRESKPDKILSFLYFQNIITYLATTGFKVPLILSERSNHRLYLTNSLKHKVWKWLLYKAYHKASSIVTVSDESKMAIMSDFHIPEEKISTIHNGLSFPLLDRLMEEPLTGFDFKKDIKYLIAVGSLNRAKNYQLLINSFSILYSKHKDTRLIIFGKGEMENQIKKLIAELDLQEAVLLAGYCENPSKYLKYATCYVLSSTWEGFPNSLLEAMYTNGHVVSTDCPTGPSEIISNNEDGLLCEVNNPLELATAMERMCFDEDFRKIVFDNSRKKIANFDEQIMIGKYRILFLK